MFTDSILILFSTTVSFSQVCNFCCKFADPTLTEKILAIKEFKQAHYDELMLNDANVVNRETRKSLTIPLDPPAALHFMPTQPIRGGGGMHVVAHPQITL